MKKRRGESQGNKDHAFLIDGKRYLLKFHATVRMNAESGDVAVKQFNEMCDISKKKYVLGVDRGEKNLIYISLVNRGTGEIEKQMSLNVINDVDYHKNLADAQRMRDEERKSWKSITNISDKRSGYLSHVIKEIVDIVDRYDPVVVLENLNEGFMGTRRKIEKSVYTQFEKALISKLNYMVLKKRVLRVRDSWHHCLVQVR